MKKNLIAAAVLVFATVGAFATAKNTSFASVFYIDDNGVCQPGQSAICAQTGTPDCVEAVTDDATGLPVGNRQVFAAKNPTTQACITPYDRP